MRKIGMSWVFAVLAAVALPAVAVAYTCDVQWADAEDHAQSGDITMDVTATNLDSDTDVGMVKTEYKVNNNGFDGGGPESCGGAALVTATQGVTWTPDGDAASATGWRCVYHLTFTPSGAGNSVVAHGGTFNSEYVIKVTDYSFTFGGAGITIPSLDEGATDYRGPDPWFATTAGNAKPIVKAQLHGTSAFNITNPPTLNDGAVAHITDPEGNPVDAATVEGTVTTVASGGWDGSNPPWIYPAPMPYHFVGSSLVAIVQINVDRPVPN
jgi:hypothetical protein